VLGAFVLQPARSRWSTETVASAGAATLGIATIAVSILRGLPALSLVMLVGGGAWITFISLVTALVQKLAPDWVRARVLAVFMLVFQGGMASGSAVWGAVGQHSDVATSLMWAGLGAIATTGLGWLWRLPDTRMDVTPWNHWRMPVIPDDLELGLESGRVLVTVEYLVDRDHASDFLKAVRRNKRIRHRDGASRWGIYRDTEHPDLYLGTFIVPSWAEHLRQHERFTRADRALEERIYSYTLKEPMVRHLIYATLKP
jgi:MFS family permease